MEQQISEGLTASFGSRIVSLDAVSAAVKANSMSGFRSGLGQEAQLCLSRDMGTFGPANLSVQAGIICNITSVKATEQVKYTFATEINGITCELSVTGGFTFYLGLSKAARREIGNRVGSAAAARLFARGVGTVLLEYLTIAGVVAAAILGMLAATYLIAWANDNAHRTGEAQGYESWYVSAYVRRIFSYRSPPDGAGNTKNPALCLELIALGQKDAVNEATTYLREIGDPAQSAQEEDRMMRFAYLAGQEAGSYEKARNDMEWELQRKYYDAI